MGPQTIISKPYICGHWPPRPQKYAQPMVVVASLLNKAPLLTALVRLTKQVESTCISFVLHTRMSVTAEFLNQIYQNVQQICSSPVIMSLQKM